jgi:biopolymer transport protein ExbD
MLVLLIVFMVTAPMLAAGVKVDLPKVQGLPPVEQRQEPLIVSVRGDGAVFLGDTSVATDALAAAVRARIAQKPDLTAHIRADAAVPYQRVLDTMAALSQAGAVHIAFIGRPGQAATEPAAPTAARPVP